MDIVSVNLGNRAHDVTVLQQRLQMQRLAGLRPDVIVTQEARSGWVTPTGYRTMPVVLPGAGQTRIVTRKAARLLGHGYVQMHPGLAHQWPARNMPYVVLDRPDLATHLCVIGVHLNSGIETAGRLSAVGERAWFALAHIEAVADFARWGHAQMGWVVAVVGDWNVHAYADRRERQRGFPSARMAAAGLVEVLPSRPSGTLGSRRVDRAFITQHHPFGVSVRDLTRRAPYDHQPILLTIR